MRAVSTGFTAVQNLRFLHLRWRPPVPHSSAPPLLGLTLAHLPAPQAEQEMGSSAWHSGSHSAVLITSQILPFSLRKSGEGSSAGSRHAPTFVVAPEGRDVGFILLWEASNSPSYCLPNLAVEFEGLDLGADVSGWWCWSYTQRSSKQWTKLGWGSHVCLPGTNNTPLLWSEGLILSAAGACNGKPACMCFLLPVYDLADWKGFGSAPRVCMCFRGISHLLQLPLNIPQAAYELTRWKARDKVFYNWF